ncbi:MAG: hypothetical protein SGBAC_013237 [Bacillariaceae sp.]
MPDYSDFISGVIGKILTRPGTFGMMPDAHPETVPFYKLINSLIKSNTPNPFFPILSNFLNGYVNILVEVMSTLAKLCNDAEEQFYDERLTLKDEKTKEFLKAIESFEFPERLVKLKNEFGKILWSTLFHDLETKLHYCWCQTHFGVGLPSIEIAQECVIIDMALELVYFTAGVVLQKIGKSANAIFKSKREINTYVHTIHAITLAKAHASGLPTGKCENSTVYVSSGFFAFARIVESTFVLNATLENMMAHCDGSLFEKIRQTFIKDSTIVDQFKSDLGLDDYYHEGDVRELLSDTLIFYQNIRSRWFANKVKGQQRRSNKSNTTLSAVKEKTIVAEEKAEVAAELKNELDPAKKSKHAIQVMYQEAIENTATIDDFVETEN